MKKRWPLFLLFPLLLILISVLVLYIWKSPKKIKAEYIGTEHSFQDIQFNTFSSNLAINEEVRNSFEEKGYFDVVYFDDGQDGRLVVMKNNDAGTVELKNTEWNEYSNPFKTIYYETILRDKVAEESRILEDNNTEITKYQIKTFYSDNKKVIYTYILHDDNTVSRFLDVFFENVNYTIIVRTSNSEKDIQEIIKSINQIN